MNDESKCNLINFRKRHGFLTILQSPFKPGDNHLHFRLSDKVLKRSLLDSLLELQFKILKRFSAKNEQLMESQ